MHHCSICSKDFISYIGFYKHKKRNTCANGNKPRGKHLLKDTFIFSEKICEKCNKSYKYQKPYDRHIVICKA